MPATFPVNNLLQAIQTLYAGNSSLNTAFGMYRELADENAPMPYCVAVFAGTTGNQFYATSGDYEDCTIRFVMYAIGESAAASALVPLMTAIESSALTLVAGVNTNICRVGGVVPRRIGHTQSTADSAVQGVVWSQTATYKFSLG